MVSPPSSGRKVGVIMEYGLEEYGLEVKMAVEEIWEAATDEQREEARRIAADVLGSVPSDDKMIQDFASYFTDQMKFEVSDAGDVPVMYM